MGDLLSLVIFGAIAAGYIVYKMGVKKGWWNKVDLKNMFK
ncbi:hypothetical protein LCGC14_1253860 [marine sediment metagenome]|uniref:Uncharacterized protein n=1 Tax=marine sediment metagenome TaxID=412755 RepID=A0A0F9P659_9ZZZZ